MLMIQCDFDDTITKDCCITYNAKGVHEPTLALLAEK